MTRGTLADGTRGALERWPRLDPAGVRTYVWDVSGGDVPLASRRQARTVLPMIVACPCCSTRYRHPEPAVVAGALAQCSRCDETFPLMEPRRAYLVLPVPGLSERVPRPVGMDDPQLAARLGVPAFEAEPQPVAPSIEPLGDDGWAASRSSAASETTTATGDALTATADTSAGAATHEIGDRAVPTEPLSIPGDARRRVWGPALASGLVGGAAAGVAAFWAGMSPSLAVAFALASGLALSLARARWNRTPR